LGGWWVNHPGEGQAHGWFCCTSRQTLAGNVAHPAKIGIPHGHGPWDITISNGDALGEEE